MAWMRTEIVIPSSLKPKEREQFAEVVLEFIRSRTLSGLDKNNNQFPEYSKQYAERKGVGISDVDLFLDGELIEQLSLLSHARGKLVIGYEKGDPINGKAEGNILGTYGQPKPIKGKKRDFLGITKSDLLKLVNIVEEEIVLGSADIDIISERAARKILGDTEID